MKILSITNYQYKNINFKGSAPINVNWRENYEPTRKDNENSHKGLPEWFRKSVLFGLITLAVVNDPSTQEYLKSENTKQKEKVLSEYFEDVSKLGSTVLMYHLNRLADVDKPVIKSKGNGNYNLELHLDNGRKIEFDVNTAENNGDIIYGYFKSDNLTKLKYKAVFNSQNPAEFIIHIRNKENKKVILGRKANGELYRLEKGKRIILNRQNAQRYQEELKRQEELDNFNFFTTKNDIWRKLNLILLFLLTINEWGHDLRKRDEEKAKLDKE